MVPEGVRALGIGGSQASEANAAIVRRSIPLNAVAVMEASRLSGSQCLQSPQSLVQCCVAQVI